MEPETDQTAQMSVAPAEPVAPAKRAHLEGVFVIVTVAALASLAIRRVGRSRLARNLQRWLGVMYTAVWGAAVLGITLMYVRGLSDNWILATWLLFLGVALASVGWLRSVMSGVAISLEGRLHIGDSVRIGDLSGEVVAFGVRSLRLRAVDGSFHEIPNEKLVTEPVTNLSGEGGDSACELLVPVPDGINADLAVQIARRVAILSPLASPRHRPEVFLESQNLDGRVEIRVRGYAFDAAYQDHFRSDVVARLQAAFRQHLQPQSTRLVSDLVTETP